MSQPVLVKVYGSFSPIDKNQASVLKDGCALAMPPDPANSPVSLTHDLCLICFEGVYFPIEDFIQQLEKILKPNMTGKLDYLDLEKWRMSRYILEDGQISVKTASLNQVLDYSGF